MNNTIIIKDPKTIITIHADHITAANATQDLVIGFLHIKTLYLHQSIALTPRECLKLSTHCELYFIDHHGNITGTIKAHA